MSDQRTWLFKSPLNPPVTVAIVRDARVLWATYGKAKQAGEPSIVFSSAVFPDNAAAMTACSGMTLFDSCDLLAAAVAEFLKGQP